MPLLRSVVLCYTIAKPPEQFRCGPLFPRGSKGNPSVSAASGTDSSPCRGAQGAGKALGDGVRRHTAALLNPCDAVQIRCSPKLRFSQARTCLAFPKPDVAFAVLYQADAVQSFAMPLLLYAFPQLFYTIPMLFHASPCQCIAQPLRWVSMPLRCPYRLSSSRASQCRCNMLLFLCCVLPSLCYASPKPRQTDA